MIANFFGATESILLVPPEERVIWEAIDLKSVMKWAFLWELIYKSNGRLIRALGPQTVEEYCTGMRQDGLKVSRDEAEKMFRKLRSYGSSYANAFLNAIVCTTLGIINFMWLCDAPSKMKYVMAVDPLDPWFNDTQSARYSAYAFLGWLSNDLIHVLLNYGPKKLGGADTVLHHMLFLTLVSVCVGFGICPFTASWLFLGELSSIPLNVRFFLINTGRGDTASMKRTNVCFAATFFLTRVALYWYGLYDFMKNGITQLVSYGTPMYIVNGVTTMICFGAVLNFNWFISIVKMAMQAPKKKSS